MAWPSFEAAELLAEEGLSVEVVNARFVKPLDTELIDDICSRFDKILTVENNVTAGGFGSAVLEYIATQPYAPNVDVLVHGLPADDFVQHGNAEELLADLNLTPAGIARVLRQFIGLPAPHSDLVSV